MHTVCAPAHKACRAQSLALRGAPREGARSSCSAATNPRARAPARPRARARAAQLRARRQAPTLPAILWRFVAKCFGSDHPPAPGGRFLRPCGVADCPKRRRRHKWLSP